MLLKSLVFAEVPLSTSEKLESGAGDAVNGKEVEPSGLACFTIVIEPGKMTASAESARSWLPPDPSSPRRLVWWGEPEMATAELFRPQSARLEMWPAQARTGFAWVAVNWIVIWRELS